jgi:DNA-3-methyladenine glycosylase II
MKPPKGEWRLGRAFSEGELRAATAHLGRVDPKLKAVIRKVGKLRIPEGFAPFESLVISIMFQQLAGSAAEAILARFKGLYSGQLPPPSRLLTTSDSDLRKTGLSRRKIEYLKDLSRRVSDGSLDLAKLSSLEDEEVISQLDAVRGIGRWTAQMYLIFTLGRPDVLPTGDLGIRAAVQRLYGLKAIPTEEEVEAVGSKWRPYSTVASLYLWRAGEAEDGGK